MSYKNYKNDFLKDSGSQDQLRKRKDMVKRDTFSKERKERYKRYVTFFRMNPSIFIKKYFGIHLHPYQVLMIWVLQRSNLAYIVASRASAKTWIIAVWSLTLAVLYPGIKVVVCAKTIKQGAIILNEKLTSLRDNYPNVARELVSITSNANVNEAIFRNGSSIKVVPSSENSRGNRANYVIVEESRLVPRDTLEGVIKPFLETRTPPFRLKPEYADDPKYLEEGIISYITSSWYKAEYWYSYVKATIRRMLSGDKTANFLAFDYLISLKHNIKTKAMLKTEMEDADPVTVQLEYLNIPSGQSGKSYFTLSMFNRNMKRAFYPQRLDIYNDRRNPFHIEKTEGEIRVISVDIATRANKTSDNTIISCARLIPNRGRGYVRHLVYMESHKGKNTVIQAKRIKEVFFDFEADMIVLDLQNAGISIFDSMTQVTTSEERGIDFPAMTVSDNIHIDEKLKEELRNRTLGIDAIPVIFPILASQALNAHIAVAFRNSLQKKMWHFLLDETSVEEFLIKTYKDFMTHETEYRAFYLNPYLNTTLFVGECVNLEMNLVNGLIKLSEKENTYKDRYTSVSYLNYVVGFFDIELLKEKDNSSDLDAILGVTQIV
jgi:hypothetical protein